PEEWGVMMDWTPGAWEAALAAMRSMSSAAEILALYDAGLITSSEIWAAAWEECYHNPALRVELSRQFRLHPDESIARIASDLEKLAAQVAERRAEKGS